MSTAGKGNAGENRAATWLEDRGWVVGGRRHRRGGGDFLCVRFGGLDVEERVLWEIMLVEVKATRNGPWAKFGPDDRRELLETAKLIRARAALIWTPTPARLELLGAEDWPGARV